MHNTLSQQKKWNIIAGAGPRALPTQQQLAQLDTSPLRALRNRNGAGADPWTP